MTTMCSTGPLEIGSEFAGYRIESLIARGGLGTVYLAKQKSLGNTVAIKVFAVEAGEILRAQAVSVARLLAELDHPNIVPVYEAGFFGDLAYVVMMFVRGPALNALLAERGRLPPNEAVSIIKQVASGLDAVHAIGVVHADVKPGNILIAPLKRALVSDFLGGRSASSNTTTAAASAPEPIQAQEPGPSAGDYASFTGTLEYVAPEVIEGKWPGPGTDVYGLGCVLYECLAGVPPFEGDSPSALILAHLAQAPPDPTTEWPEVPALLGRVVRRALAKAPDTRYRTCGELARAAISALGPEIDTRLPTPEPIAPHSESSKAPAPQPDLSTPRDPPTVWPTDEPALVSAERGWRPDPVIREPPIGHGIARVSAGAAPLIDTVDCSVYAPPEIPAGMTMLVQVFSHLPEQSDEARAVATEFDRDTERRAVRTLQTTVRRGVTLMYELMMPGLDVVNPVEMLAWRGRAEAVQFEVRVPTEAPTENVVGTVTVSLDAVPIGHVKFVVRILGPGSTFNYDHRPTGNDARHYTHAFLSYSSLDRREVLERAQMLGAFGIHYFQDVLSLEPGERWWSEIVKNIGACDLFLLFWSTHAKESETVRREVAQALGRKGTDDFARPEIKPVIVEGPPVPLPWPEIQHLHFNDRLLYVIGAEGS